jgi:hypothetical protein
MTSANRCGRNATFEFQSLFTRSPSEPAAEPFVDWREPGLAEWEIPLA